MKSKYISFENITLSFFESSGVETIIFDNLCLDIFSKKIYRLSGENGSGKSSLIKLIKGIYRPDVGKVSITEGIRYFCPNFEELPMNLKVKDYLSFYSALTPEIISLLSLNNLKKTKIDALSTGEKQRLALVPIFVEAFDMLILDESFKYIDEINRRTITAAIQERYNGRSTILFVEHEIDDLFEFTDSLNIENKHIIHTQRIIESSVAPELKKVGKKAQKKYWHLFKSHYLIYPLVFLFIAVLQLTPGLLFSSFFPISHVRQLPVVTLKSKEGAISEEVLKKVEKYEKVKYSLEYTLEPVYYNFDRVNIDYNLKDDEIHIVRSTAIHYPYEFIGSKITFNQIIPALSLQHNISKDSNADPILKIKKIARKRFKNTVHYGIYNYVSKKNYIILNQIIHFYEKFSGYVSPFTNQYYPITFSRKYDSLLTLELHPDYDIVIPKQVTLVHRKENRDNIILPIVTVFTKPGHHYEFQMNINSLENFVDDNTYVSTVVNNRKEFEEVKDIADTFGLAYYTNYTGEYKYDPIKVTMNLAIWSLAILANVTIFLYPINCKRRKYELLIEGELKGRDHLLIFGASFVTMVVSIMSIIIMKNWIFPLINLALYLALIALYFYNYNKKGEKHAKI